jgi:hypothetical protein
MAKLEEQSDRDRLERLPKWARDEIVRLRGDVEHLEAKLRCGPADSNAFLNPCSDSPTPLGKDPVIEFGERGEEMREFTVRYKNGELAINGMAPSMDDYFGVFPGSGNQVTIKHVKKR